MITLTFANIDFNRSFNFEMVISLELTSNGAGMDAPYPH